MSWDVDLCDAYSGEVVDVPSHTEGGTYAIGGLPLASLNITYNYGESFRRAWDGVGLKDALDGRLAEETIPALRHAVKVLGVQRDDDYWASTDGNAGHALSLLLGWALAHPLARWSVT
jgi:hypothetical protein